MKKQKIQFIVLALLLVLCAGGYFILKNTDLEKEEVSNTVAVTKIEKESVTGLSVSGEFSYSFVKDGEEWIEESIPGEDIKETAVDTLLTTLCALNTDEKIITAPDDLSEYGLDAPVFTVTIKHEDQETVILIGNENEILSKYFASVQGSDQVYLISAYSVSSLRKDIETFIEEPEAETETASETE